VAHDGHCTMCTQQAFLRFTLEMRSAGCRFRVSQYVCVGAPSRSQSFFSFQFGCCNQFRCTSVSGYWGLSTKMFAMLCPSFLNFRNACRGIRADAAQTFCSNRGVHYSLRLFGLGGCETKTRLQRKRLPPKFINRSIMNMKARCQRLFKAKGGQIEEGGL
jgi:hypothetical protein